MASKWIDFAALKKQVPIADVLRRYGYLEGLAEKKPGKLVGPCPLHNGTGSSSFHVDTKKNVYNCFSRCGGGNVLDLVQTIEGIEIREAGEKLSAWFGLKFERPENGSRRRNSAKVSEKIDDDAAAGHDSASDDRRINPPLERSLSNLNRDHAYLTERGLTVQTVNEFEIGYCTRGMMRGRIAIPIHDQEGTLVGYAGRAISAELAKEKGKYRLPSNEQGFYKSHLVFNLHRAKDKGPLIVVEGFFDCMAVHQAGFENVVALMGSSLSAEQELLLLGHSDRLALMLDGDEAGTACKRDIWKRLVRKLYLRDIHLEDGEQPDALSADRIRELLF